MPTYAHLVDSYSEKVKNEWKVKVEDMSCEEFEGNVQVKEECQDYSSIAQTVNKINSTNPHMVM